MAHSLLRPTEEEAAKIYQTLLVSEQLPPVARRALNIVLVWSRGQSPAQIAAALSPRCNRETVRRIVLRYRQGGIPAILLMRRGRVGHPPTPSDQEETVVKTLRDAFARGAMITYRELSRQTGVSVTTIAAIAKRHKLDGPNRRGPVSPA